MVAVPAHVGPDTPGHPGGSRATRTGTARRRSRLPLLLAVSIAVGAGVVLRRPTAAPLWLDEALSVDIAGRPVPHLLAALGRDGSPPLYYLLLHGWMDVVGADPAAVRLLSGLISVAALPVGFVVARSVAGRPAGVAALLLLASNPFLVRYATETRMYALVVLLSLLAVRAGWRAWERATVSRLAAVAVLTAALLLTHYWTVFALLAAAVALLVVAVRTPARRPTVRRLLVAGAAGGLLFVPWSPTFWFQMRHTGTPWAEPAGLTAAGDTVAAWTGGPSAAAAGLAVIGVAAVLIAVSPAQAGNPARRPRFPTGVARFLAGVAIGGLLLAVLASRLSGAGFSPRYTSAFVAPALLAAALGLAALRPRLRVAAVAAVTVLGLAIGSVAPPAAERTQAGRTADLIAGAGRSGDLVLYCPDQLGPAVSRLLPASMEQAVYPTLAAPDLIDWVDYGARNAAADPAVVAARLDATHAGRIWLVTASGYRTFDDQCEQLTADLADRRGGAPVAQIRDPRYVESQALRLIPARS